MTTTMTPNSFTDLARQLTKGRLDRNWTQQQLADAASMPRSAVARPESGNASASLTTLQRLADALGECLIVRPAQQHRTYRISRLDHKHMQKATRLRMEHRQAGLPEPTLTELVAYVGEPESWFYQFYSETFPAPAATES